MFFFIAALITILGIIYVLSPIDFIPEIVLGPIGLVDDVVVILTIILVWMIYFSLPLLTILFNLIIAVTILCGLFYLAFILYKKLTKKKKIRLTLKRRRR